MQRRWAGGCSRIYKRWRSCKAIEATADRIKRNLAAERKLGDGPLLAPSLRHKIQHDGEDKGEGAGSLVWREEVKDGCGRDDGVVER